MKRKSIPLETARLLTIIELHLPYLQNAARVYDGKAEHHYHLCMTAVNELRKLHPVEEKHVPTEKEKG